MRKPLPAEIAEIIPTIKANPRPFHNIAIVDCGEPLVSLETGHLYAFENPHPYLATGAPYGKASPFMLRKTVAEKLAAAQALLAQKKAGWRLKVFDGFRPLDVQAHMVAFTFIEVAQEYGFDALNLDDAERAKVLEKVYRIWSPPTAIPKHPRPTAQARRLIAHWLMNRGAMWIWAPPLILTPTYQTPIILQKTPMKKAVPFILHARFYAM